MKIVRILSGLFSLSLHAFFACHIYNIRTNGCRSDSSHEASPMDLLARMRAQRRSYRPSPLRAGPNFTSCDVQYSPSVQDLGPDLVPRRHQLVPGCQEMLAVEHAAAVGGRRSRSRTTQLLAAASSHAGRSADQTGRSSCNEVLAASHFRRCSTIFSWRRGAARGL